MNASCSSDIKLELSVIIPCYNERDNVEPLFQALVKALEGRKWEAIFVDDHSPDGTIDRVWQFAQYDQRIRGILRVDRRGLSSAVIEGVLSSSAQCVAVIDGDMQHDETCLPIMLDAVLKENYDFAVGSRHVEGGDTSGLANRWRHFLSNTGIQISQRFLPVSLHDPMSGFFLLKREIFLDLLPKLSGTGFKILLDLVMSSPKTTRLKEVPFRFRERLSGKSKLDFKVMIQFIIMLIEKLFQGFLPTILIVSLSWMVSGVVVDLLFISLNNKISSNLLQGQLLGAICSTCFIGLGYRFYMFKKYKNLSSILFFLLAIVGIIANLWGAQLSLTFNYGFWTAGFIGVLVGMVWNMLIVSNLVFYK